MYQIKYEKLELNINHHYKGVQFANNIGTTESKYLAEVHKSQGATVTEVKVPQTPQQPQTPQTPNE